MEIEVKSLCKEYDQLKAVNNVSFKLPSSSILALIGPNGSGKTSLLKMMAALVEPTSGDFIVGEINGAIEPKRIHAVVGFLPDHFGLYEDLTLNEYLEYFARAHQLLQESRQHRVQTVIADVGLKSKANTKLRNLSRGMRQRVGVARALIHDPPVILLDEPASGLDPEARSDLQLLLSQQAKRGRTVVVSSHILTELEEYCSHVAIMREGNLLAFGNIDQFRGISNSQRIFFAEFNASVPELEFFLNFHDGVSEVKFEDDFRQVRFRFDGNSDKVAGLVRLLVEKKFPLLSFREDQTKIQDAYRTVMKGRRDD